MKKELTEKYKEEQVVVNNEGSPLYALKGIANVPIGIANLPTETAHFVANIKENLGSIKDVVQQYRSDPEFRENLHANFPEMLDKAIYENPLDFIELGM